MIIGAILLLSIILGVILELEDRGIL